MLSSRETKCTEESFTTPLPSADDLMAHSPDRHQDNVVEDLLTGADFSICDVTLQDNATYDELVIDDNNLNYLAKCSESNKNTFMDRGKESLFVKFDPLYAPLKCASSTSHTESSDSTEYDIGYETGSALSVCNGNDTVITPSTTISTSAASNKDKPMQVVPPVMHSEILKANITTRATPQLFRSVSAILTPTQVATDRLISITGNTPPVPAPRSPHYQHYTAQKIDRLQSLRHILQKQDQEIFFLRGENRELRAALQETEYKCSKDIEDLMEKIKKLTEDKEHLIVKENRLIQQVNDRMLSNKQMSTVMVEYENTISSLIAEQQRNKISSHELHEKLITERDQALNHLLSMESSFNDLLAKYEKCKGIVMEAKEREKMFEETIANYEIGLKKYEVLYSNLKEVTSDNLAKANETLENLKKNHNVEITKLNASVRKQEVTISSLQELLSQKTRDNEELSRICDQLINGVN